MRNIFDQYSQPENRVTHALMTALNEDQTLLDAFLKDIAKHIPPKKSGPLSITEQSYPGSVVSDGINEDEIKRPGIPDAWITGDKTKFQPEWIKAVFAILKSKKSNIEMQVGAKFPYRTCKAIQEPQALDFVAAAWIACKLYIRVINDEGRKTI